MQQAHWPSHMASCTQNGNGGDDDGGGGSGSGGGEDSETATAQQQQQQQQQQQAAAAAAAGQQQAANQHFLNARAAPEAASRQRVSPGPGTWDVLNFTRTSKPGMKVKSMRNSLWYPTGEQGQKF